MVLLLIKLLALFTINSGIFFSLMLCKSQASITLSNALVLSIESSVVAYDCQLLAACRCYVEYEAAEGHSAFNAQALHSDMVAQVNKSRLLPCLVGTLVGLLGRDICKLE